MYVNKTTTTRKQQHNKTKEQQPLSHKERNLKTHVADTMVSNILRDLQFSLNQLLKSADKWYIGILQNIIKLKNIQTFSAVLYFPVTGLDCNMIIDCRVLKSNIYICIYIYIYIYISLIHSLFCLTTGPKPPPKQCLHIVPSTSSSFQ